MNESGDATIQEHGPEFESAGDFARRVNRTPKYVYSWAKSGMPHEYQDGRLKIRVAEATAWVAKNKISGGGGWGGPRFAANPSGLARPRPPPVPPGPPGPSPVPVNHGGASEERDRLRRLAEIERAAADISGDEPGDVDYSVTGLLALSTERCLQLKIIEEVLTKRFERLRLEGGYVEAREWKRQLGMQADAARRELRRASKSISQQSAAEFGLDPAQRDQLEAIARESISDIINRLFGSSSKSQEEDSAAS
jgi:hypothetical protein